LDRICADCEDQAGKNDILLANIDGPDTDSGTSVEFGIARKSEKKPITICIRTDFRTDLGKEIGYNAMFKRADGFVYHPSFTLTDDIDISNFYDQLVEKIDAAIMEARRKRDKAKKRR
jgi:nucleoside 2-deoxyribosyltransferase